MSILSRLLLLLALGSTACMARAEGVVAVLDFELYDLTLTPRSPAEVARTASIAPLLREGLNDRGLQTVAVATADQQAADKGVGYLFEHPKVAAELGRQAGADWVIAGRLHKPTDLFAYIKATVIDATRGEPVAAFTIEVKGPSQKVTAVGVNRLAEEIAQAVAETMDDDNS